MRSATRSTSTRSWLVSSTVTPCVAEQAEERPRRRPALDVHPGRRLVEDDQLGAADERERQPEALPLPAGQPPIPRPATDSPRPTSVEQLVRGRDRRLVERAVEREHLAGGHPRVDPAAALEHQPDPRPVVAPGRRRIRAEDPDPAAIRPPVALEDLDRRGLAGTVRPEQREQSRRAAIAERHAVDDRAAAVALRRARRPRPPPRASAPLRRFAAPAGDVTSRSGRPRSARTGVRSRRPGPRRSGSIGGSRRGR